MKKARLTALVLLTALLLSGILSACHSKSIVGTWVELDSKGNTEATYVFARNGKGSIKSEGDIPITGDMTWSTEGNVLSVSVTVCGQHETEEYYFDLQGNTLKLINISDSSDVMTLYKK